jgi:hypothetical protein
MVIGSNADKAIGKKVFMTPPEESDVRSEVAGRDNPTKFVTSDTGLFPLLSESMHKVKIGNYEFLAGIVYYVLVNVNL